MPEIDLTQSQRLAIFAALRPFAARFAAVGVYGSRATGHALPGSDLDLVVYGAADGALAADMRQALADSDLSIFADVVSFDSITNEVLRAGIVRDGLILHHRQDFAAGEGAIR
jgi:predicted nucleotidyltransferase